MRILFHAAAVGLVCLVGSARGQGTLRITFDGPPAVPPGSDISVRSYSESGMSFRPITMLGAFGRVGPGYAADPQNGSAYLRAAFTDSLMFSFANGSLFDLLAVDLAEYSTLFQTPLSVSFVGYRPDGSSVSAILTTDGVIDGTGPLADFQTFQFGPEFRGLTRVEVPTSGWSLDNLVVSVPEPGSGVLLLSGLSLLFARRCLAKKC